jgi:hypothetical protein
MEVEELGQVVTQEAGVLPNPETKIIFKCLRHEHLNSALTNPSNHCKICKKMHLDIEEEFVAYFEPQFSSFFQLF